MASKNFSMPLKNQEKSITSESFMYGGLFRPYC
jgi:hypothetical protein